MPSDLGYDDARYVLPPLTVTDHIVSVDGPTGDMLFPELSTKGLTGRLNARRGSLSERVELAADLVTGGTRDHCDCQWLLWCGLNPEAEALATRLTGSVNVQGSDKYAEKVGAVTGFVRGSIRTLIS